MEQPSTPHEIDITGDVCPMTFVRCKLLLDGLKAGEQLRITLRDGEPLRNVPRGLRDHGYVILDLSLRDPSVRADEYVLLVLKP